MSIQLARHGSLRCVYRCGRVVDAIGLVHGRDRPANGAVRVSDDPTARICHSSNCPVEIIRATEALGHSPNRALLSEDLSHAVITPSSLAGAVAHPSLPTPSIGYCKPVVAGLVIVIGDGGVSIGIADSARSVQPVIGAVSRDDTMRGVGTTRRADGLVGLWGSPGGDVSIQIVSEPCGTGTRFGRS